MKRKHSFNIVALLLIASTLVSCGKASTSSTSSVSNSSCSLPTTAGSVAGALNVLSVGVGTTSLCAGNINIPCTSVTICQHGTANCQTISDILVDTGSFGLRIFSQAINNPVLSALTHVTDGSAHQVAECAQFGSAVDWGPVMNADVVLGGESAVQASIQVIDHTFGTATLPSACSAAETGPTQAGINGILGVGLLSADCGTGCAVTPGLGNIYWGCNAGTCTKTTLAVASQVTNPVALLPLDNNGVILQMPAVGASGISAVTGSLVLGIDTRANNASSGFTMYPASSSLTFSTSAFGHNYSGSFIDSGSNGYFFPTPNGWNTCGSFYCNGNTSANTATMTGFGGSPAASVCFTIGDSNSLFSTGQDALSDIGANAGFSNAFDWGLPFFYGRKVYVGINGTVSSLGTGPYWAF